MADFPKGTVPAKRLNTDYPVRFTTIMVDIKLMRTGHWHRSVCFADIEPSRLERRLTRNLQIHRTSFQLCQTFRLASRNSSGSNGTRISTSHRKICSVVCRQGCFSTSTQTFSSSRRHGWNISCLSELMFEILRFQGEWQRGWDGYERDGRESQERTATLWWIGNDTVYARCRRKKFKIQRIDVACGTDGQFCKSFSGTGPRKRFDSILTFSAWCWHSEILSTSRKRTGSFQGNIVSGLRLCKEVCCFPELYICIDIGVHDDRESIKSDMSSIHLSSLFHKWASTHHIPVHTLPLAIHHHWLYLLTLAGNIQYASQSP